MHGLTLEEWSAIAQVVTAVITLLGILVSIWLSTNALREIQLDRRLRSKPNLAFEIGGWHLPVEFVEVGSKIPGYDPQYMAKIFGDLPKDAESIRLKLSIKDEIGSRRVGYGRLRNYGGGPALGTHVIWVPNEIWVGSERFELDDRKRLEPVYRSNLNTWPAIPSNIQPGEESSVNCIPTFITKDIEKKITRVNGLFIIKCKDIFGDNHVVLQEFYLFPNYKEAEKHIHVTFGDIRTEELTEAGSKTGQSEP